MLGLGIAREPSGHGALPPITTFASRCAGARWDIASSNGPETMKSHDFGPRVRLEPAS